MQIEHIGQVALMRMNAGKANALSPESIKQLGGLLDEVQRSDARALVMTGYDRFFCAGLALPSLLGLDRDEMRVFMQSFGAFMSRLFSWPQPVVAAINGHAVAGGCVLAMQADVRLMRDDLGKVGLSEVGLGLGLPPVALEVLRGQVPKTSLLPVALEGRLLPPSEALELGLVHELVAPDNLETQAVAKAARMALLPSHSFAKIKLEIRAPVIDRIAARQQAEGESWLDAWFAPTTQEILKQTVAKLSS